ALVELECIVEETLARCEHSLLHVMRYGSPERAQCHHLLAEPAAIQIRIWPTGLPRLDEVAALRPVPLGTGEKTVGGERRQVCMIAAAHDAAAFRCFDRDLRAVDVGDDNINALIDQRIHSLSLFDRIVPVAGD